MWLSIGRIPDDERLHIRDRGGLVRKLVLHRQDEWIDFSLLGKENLLARETR